MKHVIYSEGPPVVRIGPERAIVIERDKPSPPLADELAAQLLDCPFPVFTEVPDKGQAKPQPAKPASQAPTPTPNQKEA